MNRLRQSVLSLALLLAWGASAALAQSSPVGSWRTIDDESGEARSIVEISETNGELTGRVVEVLEASDDARYNEEGQVICSACDGARKGRPVEGMIILSGLKKDGDEWKGGTILDPANGKTYKAKVKMKGKDGLEVRGYIGVPLFGRTQTWQRVTS